MHPQTIKTETINIQSLPTIQDVAELDQSIVKPVRRAITAGLLDAMRVGPGGSLIRIDRAAHRAYRKRDRGDHYLPSMSIFVSTLRPVREDPSALNGTNSLGCAFKLTTSFQVENRPIQAFPGLFQCPIIAHDLAVAN